ncbi:MAG: S1C family serine protease [Gemmataceae bacterium]|nr:S1C family serine protease [Gemmataceae bacterium]
MDSGRRMRWSAVALLVAGGMAWGAAAPPSAAVKERLKVFLKAAPEGPADLRIISEEAKAVLKTAIPATVGLQVGGASGSGVIISEDGYVLTAGHVSGRPGQVCDVILSDGQRVKGKTLGQNNTLDSGLIKITTPGKYAHVPMGRTKDMKAGTWVVAVGHPRGFIPGRSPVVRVGRVVAMPNGIWRRHIQTDCALVGGDSGGPLFDMNGRVVGIHSNINLPVEVNNHVPVDTYRETWARLDAGESWPARRPRVPPPSVALGVQFDGEGGSSLNVTGLRSGFPAEGAGVQVGDVIKEIDGVKLGKRSDLIDYLRKKKPDDEITLKVDREGKSMTMKIKLARQR